MVDELSNGQYQIQPQRSNIVPTNVMYGVQIVCDCGLVGQIILGENVGPIILIIPIIPIVIILLLIFTIWR